jgi:FeS assembly SUF system protein
MTEDTAPATNPSAPKSEPASEAATTGGDLREAVIAEIRTVFDPEIPVNIYDLGLIYEVGVKDDKDIHVKMTLTSPSCPVAGSLPGEVKTKIEGVNGVATAIVELVWEPTWTPECMSEDAKIALGVPMD